MKNDEEREEIHTQNEKKKTLWINFIFFKMHETFFIEFQENSKRRRMKVEKKRMKICVVYISE